MWLKIIAMDTFLFDKIIFGPVQSRRLGISLGINLLPTERKWCNFNCIYCECGYTPDKEKKPLLFPRATVSYHLNNKLKSIKENKQRIDALTFAGNGEPTLHPEFEGIIEDTLRLRDKYFPDAKVAVLTNSTLIHNPSVFNALSKVDQNILKLDSGNSTIIHKINRPNKPVNIEKLVDTLKKFDNAIIQTMFIEGELNGQNISNTSEKEIDNWLNLIKQINPVQVMVYTTARATPSDTILPVSKEKLDNIAEQVKNAGFDVHVSY